MRIAEEARHADEQLLEEELDLTRVLAQIANVVAELVDLLEPHSPLDAAVDRAPLVEGEVVAGVGPEQDEHLLERAQLLLLERRLRVGEVRRMPVVAHDAGGELLGLA